MIIYLYPTDFRLTQNSDSILWQLQVKIKQYLTLPYFAIQLLMAHFLPFHTSIYERNLYFVLIVNRMRHIAP